MQRDRTHQGMLQGPLTPALVLKLDAGQLAPVVAKTLHAAIELRRSALCQLPVAGAWADEQHLFQMAQITQGQGGKIQQAFQLFGAHHHHCRALAFEHREQTGRRLLMHAQVGKGR